MAEQETALVRTARDGYEDFFTEKLWSLLPGVYKDEDLKEGRANPGVLRAIVQVLAAQGAIERRSIDRTWEDAFIEYCDDWAITYIAELLGTRTPSALTRRGRRVSVAKTIFYRRRSGTLTVLETLIKDITGWDGTVVEAFRRIARFRHMLDCDPLRPIGPCTKTPSGGVANIRNARTGFMVEAPFDELHYTPDVRRHEGPGARVRGRIGIPELNVYLYRLRAFDVTDPTPFGLDAQRFLVDPSGRDIPLFRPSLRGEDERVRNEWEVRAPIDCRLFNKARYRVTVAIIDGLTDLAGAPLDPAAKDDLRPFVDIVFESEARLRKTIESLPTSSDFFPVPPPEHPPPDLTPYEQVVELSILPREAKTNLWPGAVAVSWELGPSDKPIIPRAHVIAGHLGDWGASLTLPEDKKLVVDPERGRLWFPPGTGPDPNPPGTVRVELYHYGFLGEIGAGIYDRRTTVVTGPDVNELPDGEVAMDPGPITLDVADLQDAGDTTGVHQINNNKTYEPNGDVVDVVDLTLQARSGKRPYVVRRGDPSDVWTFSSKAASENDPPAEMTLEGLWIGIDDGSDDNDVADLKIEGFWDCITIRHCTLDPGGTRADDAESTIPHVRLLIDGFVERLIIQESIVGSIVVGDNGTLEELTILDSIVVEDPTGTNKALDTLHSRLTVERSTIMGRLDAEGLFATEVLLTGLACVLDSQGGCFRFSAAPFEGSRLPPKFRSHDLGDMPILFMSTRFGDPDFAQLQDVARPREILTGGENGSEIGAFNRLLGPLKLAGLRAKMDEFTPFGRITQFINET